MSIVILPKRKGLRLTCKKCQYDWVYTGASKFRASCPRCGTTVRLTRTDLRKDTGTYRGIQIPSENKKLSRTTPEVGRPLAQSPIVETKTTERGDSVT